MKNHKTPNTSFTRLYRQAEEFTNAFWLEYDSDGAKFAFFFEKGTESITFNSLAELKEFRNVVKKKLQEGCKSVDAQYSIPLFIDLMTSNYNEKYSKNSFRPIIAAKLALTFIWKNTIENASSSNKSFSKLFEILNIAECFVVLEQLLLVWEFEELGELSMDVNGHVRNSKYSKLSPQFALQGRNEYKVVEDAIKQIWDDPNALDKLTLIITNSVPQGLTLFGNSFLSEISLNNKTFWHRVWSIFYIYHIAIYERAKIKGNDYLGMSLIPQGVFGGVIFNTADANKLQSAIYENFWQPEWYRLSVNKTYFVLQGMLVERPILRIDQSKNTFVTSIFLLHDALNRTLENFVHSNKGSHIYEKYFSQPFETKTINLFRAYNFLAGEVNINGLWQLEEPILLDGPSNMPGQIDILIVSHTEKLIVLADCKMLHFPYEVNKLNNLRSKFTFQDSEGFYSKLEKKAHWISLCNNIPKDYRIITILFTNRHVILPDDDHRVFSIDEVGKLLKREVKMGDWVG